MAMASSRLQLWKQVWAQRGAAAYSSTVRRPHGVKREGDSYARPSPGSDHSHVSSERTRVWKPEFADGSSRPNVQPRIRVPNEMMKTRASSSAAAVAVGDKSQKNSGLNQGEAEQPDPVPFMTTDFCDHRGMQIVFLGTSSSMPTLSRNTSCIALRLDGTIYMFDCGEGVQRQLHRTQFRHRAIDNIFITHMHGDHDFSRSFRSLDFQEGLLCMIGMTAPSTRQPVEIYGPPGLRDWIRTTLKLAHARVPNKYIVHELVLQEGKRTRGSYCRKVERANDWNISEECHEDELPGKDIPCSQDDGLWHVHEDSKYKVVAGLLKHTIPCWGYVVEERPKIGRFDVERAKEVGVLPGPMCAKLQQGHSVALPDGRTVNPSDVLGPPRKGRKAVILGDTSDSRSLLVAARGADVVVHEATVLEQEARLASHRGHSTASSAGRFARMIDAKSLVLTHFSGKLEGSLYGTSEKGTIADLVRAAKRAFGKQSVMAAHDLAAVTVVANLDEPLSTH